MIYKQTTPMQWITLYYYGDNKEKMKLSRKGKQMRRFIRYSNVIEEIREEELKSLSDSEKHFVGMTNTGLIVMFENNH